MTTEPPASPPPPAGDPGNPGDRGADAAAPPPRALSYADAGVDVAAADATVNRYKEITARATRPEVLGGVGPFAGLFELGRYERPVLVSSADGVGTKVLLAAVLGRYAGVGRDLVHHSINDILTAGAEPLFFLDYLATADLAQDDRVELVRGMGEACAEHGVALIGGETADMPGLYQPGDFDLAGFIVGVVERERLLDPAAIRPRDALLGLPSNGLHTNGYSLVREAFAVGTGRGPEHDRSVLEREYAELGGTLGDALLVPHHCYLPDLRPVLDRLRAWSHITGGGIAGNLARVLPAGIDARLDRASWAVPPLFELIQRRGNVSDREMFGAFNMGVGAILAVAPEHEAAVTAAVPGAWRIGELVAADGAGGTVHGLPG